jgi:ribosomal protein S18 acetylase RimI-like enzyme
MPSPMDAIGVRAAPSRWTRATPPDLDALRPADVAEAGRIHCAVLPDGLLARLGPGVLSEVYAGALDAPGVVALVVRHDGRLGGFLLATADTRALFRHVLRRRGLRLVPRLLAAVGRRPEVLVRLVESLRYPATLGDGQQAAAEGAELLALAVRPECRSAGYATALVTALDDRFRRTGVDAYSVGVYSSNAGANGLYRRLGFQPAHEFRMFGAAWTRYRRPLGPIAPRWSEGPLGAPRLAGSPDLSAGRTTPA